MEDALRRSAWWKPIEDWSGTKSWDTLLVRQAADMTKVPLSRAVPHVASAEHGGYSRGSLLQIALLQKGSASKRCPFRL